MPRFMPTVCQLDPRLAPSAVLEPGVWPAPPPVPMDLSPEGIVSWQSAQAELAAQLELTRPPHEWEQSVCDLFYQTCWDAALHKFGLK